MKLLEGKTAVITGAARGIGKAIALRFASEGANIAFTDLRIDETGEATEHEISAMGVKCKGYASNAADFDDTHRVVEEIVKDFGRIDILINNAASPGWSHDAHERAAVGCGDQREPEISIQLHSCHYPHHDAPEIR